MVPTRVLVLFPFSLGKDPNERRKILEILKQILDAVRSDDWQLHTSLQPPILFVNRVSVENDDFAEIEKYLGCEAHKDCWQVVRGWSVDTCQDWLYGWGKVIDDWEAGDQQGRLGLLQIPGDLRDVGDFGDTSAMTKFLSKLEEMTARVAAGNDFVIGDYTLRQTGGKYLIDAYGTLPLLYNWFPDVADYIRNRLNLARPRSEFIAAEIHFLQEMLVNHKRFAYEQTTAFLINALSTPETPQGQARRGKKWDIRTVDLGVLQDHTGDRGFREAVDQLERMERMMRLLWRSLHGADKFDVDRYFELDTRSGAIRSAAMVTFRNFLQPTGGSAS